MALYNLWIIVPDVISLEVEMWIILIFDYNLQIMPIILPIMHHNPNNPQIIP